MEVQYRPVSPEHFSSILTLGNAVHGNGYLTDISIQMLYQASWLHNVNASWVALKNQKLIGFRLTQAAGNWEIDQWCTPSAWQLESEKICYFKCNTVNANYRGLGIGSELLRRSIKSVKQQGSQAGLAHIWLASPGNSAFKYFSKAGGKLIKEHPGKWSANYVDYPCPLCGEGCHCVAGEMLLRF